MLLNNLPSKDYDKLQHVIFAITPWGQLWLYQTMDQQFFDDSSDIYFLHKDQQDNPKLKVLKKNKTKI